MNKVNLRVERIFAHAAALQQNGRLRNSVYCYKKYIYILNQDHTVMLQFPLRKGEAPFQNPVSFEANDYDSSHFEEKDGYICFMKKFKDKYIREKKCKTPQFIPLKVHKMFKERKEGFKKVNSETLGKDFISLLDESLSHIEFSGRKGKLITQQRNIYSGSVITIQQQDKKGLDQEKPLKSFKPIGLRTNDFLALFTFVDNIQFYFKGNNAIWFQSKDRLLPFNGLVSQCMYDELGG